MKLCMGCMEEIEDHMSKCPFCGYEERACVQESYYLQPGSVVGGKYIVGRALKYTGYTVSYLGMDAERNCKVTLSEYLPSEFSTRSEGDAEVTIYSGDALEQFNQGLMSFLNEGSKLQKLGQVSGIAQVYDCFAENDTGYLVSEYQQSMTLLQEQLENGKRYSMPEAKKIICCLLAGLQKVHAAGVLHCDIAPDNILIGEDGMPKLTDFGSSKYATTSHSKSLAIILKQGYAPEELYRSQGQRGPWTDIYALAAVMYHMLTGKVPPESVDRALEDEMPIPSKQGVAITQAEENALLNAMNVYQNDRTKTAAEFQRELNSKDVKRIRGKKGRTDTGKMPVWVRAFVAAGIVFILAGSAFVVKMRMNRTDVSSGSAIKRFALKECGTEEKFEEFWKENSFDTKLPLDKVHKAYQYDSDAEGNEVAECDWLYDGLAVNKINDKIKEHKTLSLTIASDRKYDFQDAWVYGCQNKKDAIFHEVKGKNKSLPDGYLEKIIYNGKTYSMEYTPKGSIRKQSLKELPKYLEYDGDKNPTFVFYVGDYYTGTGITKERCIGKSPAKLKLFTLVSVESGGKKKKQALPDNKTEASFYSFVNGDRSGDVKELNSNIKKGKYSSKTVRGYVFYTVKERMYYGKTTVKQLAATGVRIENRDRYQDNQLIVSCKCKNGDRDGQQYFKRGDTVTIQVKDPKTPKPAEDTTVHTAAPYSPQSTPKPKQPVKDDGLGGGTIDK